MTFSIIHFFQYISGKVVEYKQERHVGNVDVNKQLNVTNMVLGG